MALGRCAGVCYDRDLFLTLDSNFMCSHVAIMLKILKHKTGIYVRSVAMEGGIYMRNGNSTFMFSTEQRYCPSE